MRTIFVKKLVEVSDALQVETEKKIGSNPGGGDIVKVFTNTTPQTTSSSLIDVGIEINGFDGLPVTRGYRVSMQELKNEPVDCIVENLLAPPSDGKKK